MIVIRTFNFALLFTVQYIYISSITLFLRYMYVRLLIKKERS